MPTKNWEVFAKDPRSSTIPNDGVTEVGLPTTEKEWDVLRYELSTFVCEGEYERGLERILNTYLTNLDQSVQPAVWVSGFYGSGKSHLVRVLEYLWRDVAFPDGATARSLVTLPDSVRELLVELGNKGKQARRALGRRRHPRRRRRRQRSPRHPRHRLPSGGLPENYAQGRFVLWLKQQNLYEAVREHVRG